VLDFDSRYDEAAQQTGPAPQPHRAARPLPEVPVRHTLTSPYKMRVLRQMNPEAADAVAELLKLRCRGRIAGDSPLFDLTPLELAAMTEIR
jgi:hypothetical protein